MVEKFSIVKLTKAMYNKEHVTEADPTPRLLVIRVYTNTMQYLVRYPDAFIQRVNADWVLTKGVFDLEHPSYVRYAKVMKAVEVEFRKNEQYSTQVNNVYPEFAIELEQKIEAKQQAYRERHAAPPITVQDIVPELPAVAEATTAQDRIISILKSIDESLITLVQLWEGK